MSYPELTPTSNSSKSILPSTGSFTDVDSACPLRLYSDSSSPLYSAEFITGAVQQVTYTYRKLGGDTLDLEILPQTVYAAFEDAVIEYSYISNLYTARNYMGSMLGQDTSSFDHKGEYESGSFSSSMGGKNAALVYPKFDYSYQRRVGMLAAHEANLNGDRPVYSASIDLTDGIQDYDLQAIISASAASGSVPYADIGNKKINVRKVYYKSPRTQWRFFGYGFGGYHGNVTGYGSWSDVTSFEIIPNWQNKLAAQAYEDSWYTRISHYSYEIKNNKLRIFPLPETWSANKVWIEFYVGVNNFVETSGSSEDSGLNGVNSLNNVPYSNLPYNSINSIGKQWIRRYALASTLETLGLNRSKFGTIPIPGESVTLNGGDLITRAREDKEKLIEQLKAIFEELTPQKIVETDKAIADAVNGTLVKVPRLFYVG